MTSEARDTGNSYSLSGPRLQTASVRLSLLLQCALNVYPAVCEYLLT